MAVLKIKRGAELIPLLSRGRAIVPTKAEQRTALLGEDVVVLTLSSAEPLQLELGDVLEVFGRDYTLNQLPSVKKSSARSFEYTLTFEGVQYELIDTHWLLPDDTKLDSLTGTLSDFARILIDNANRAGGGRWRLGNIPQETETKTLTYQGRNTLEVLQDLCREYDTEFAIEQTAEGLRILHLGKAGSEFPYTFRYGKAKGLYQISRGNVEGKDLATRLYAYGGVQNLPDGYRYNRLCLPTKEKNQSYIEEADKLSAFGVKEGIKTFEDIFPNRYGEVTALGDKVHEFADSSMPFDLNERKEDRTHRYLISGVTAKVHFTTGQLAGYEFEIKAYDHARHTFALIPYTDATGMEFPSKTSRAFQLSVGDKYFISDIRLPQSYIDEAEALLERKARDHYAQYSSPQVSYALQLDEAFLSRYASDGAVANLFSVGDYIKVEDEDLKADRPLRIQSLTRDLLSPYKYTLSLSDSVQRSTITRVIGELNRVDEVIKTHKLEDKGRARMNWRTTGELMGLVFDGDGDYYSEKIKPGSIETQALSVGAKSGQFALIDTTLTPNHEGKASVLGVVGGELEHYAILTDGGKPRRWKLSSGLHTLEHPDKPYYIYARVEREGEAGSIVLDTEQRLTDGEPSYYTLLVGVLHSQEGGARAVNLLNGFTFINGRYITTGRIQSQGGDSYLDLDTGAFSLGDAREGLSWNHGGNRRLVLSGALVQSRGGALSPIGVYLGAWSAETLYSRGDEVSYKGATYRFVGAEPAQGIEPTDKAHWQVIASRGADGKAGAGLVYRGEYKSGAEYYATDQRRDIVLHDGLYYIASVGMGSFQTDEFDPADWEPFGAQFESVATKALYAESINADNLRVRRLWGGDDDESSPRLYARGKELSFYQNQEEEKKDEKRTSGDHATVRIGLGVGYMIRGYNKPGISARDAVADAQGYKRYSELSSGGIFTNGSAVSLFPPSTGRAGIASSVSLLTKREEGGISLDTIAVNAAVSGRDQTDDKDYPDSVGFGGWFNKLHASGLNVSVRIISSANSHEERTLTHEDVYVIAQGRIKGLSFGGAVYAFVDIVLPEKPYKGQLLYIKRDNNGEVYLLGNGKKIKTHILQDRKEIPGVGDTALLVFDGVQWHYNHMYR